MDPNRSLYSLMVMTTSTISLIEPPTLQAHFPAVSADHAFDLGASPSLQRYDRGHPASVQRRSNGPTIDIVLKQKILWPWRLL
jgi:hypothetical protein